MSSPPTPGTWYVSMIHMPKANCQALCSHPFGGFASHCSVSTTRTAVARMNCMRCCEGEGAGGDMKLKERERPEGRSSRELCELSLSHLQQDALNDTRFGDNVGWATVDLERSYQEDSEIGDAQ